MDAFTRSVCRFRSIIAAATFVFLFAGFAQGHKVKVFATAEGKRVVGYAYFSGGGRPRNVAVGVFAPGGKKLRETKTNDKGEFAFEAAYRCDHVLKIDTGDGHAATFTVTAAELPDDLPGLDGPADGSPAEESPAANPSGRVAATPVAVPADMEKALARIVSKEIRPLREQIERSEEKRTLRDVLGGVGYIFGIAGIVFYFLGTRKIEKAKMSMGSPDP